MLGFGRRVVETSAKSQKPKKPGERGGLQPFGAAARSPAEVDLALAGLRFNVLVHRTARCGRAVGFSGRVARGIRRRHLRFDSVGSKEAGGYREAFGKKFFLRL